MSGESTGDGAAAAVPEETRVVDGEGAAFGIFLRQTRLHRGLTLEETARDVKVPEHFLEALEDEDYDALPPKPYVKGFLDAYSTRLSLDPSEVWGRYEESYRRFSRSGSDERRAIFAIFLPEGERLQWRDWAVPMVLAGAALAVLAVRGFTEGGGKGREGAPPPAVELSLPAPAALDTAAVERVAETTAAVPASGKVDGVNLLLRAESGSWLAVERDGSKAEEWIMEEGETRVVTAKKTIVLSLGNAGAVQLNVNGRELGFIGYKGEVKRNVLFSADEQ